jgi:hypothetical protein
MDPFDLIRGEPHGPPISGGPFTTARAGTAALQIATNLCQFLYPRRRDSALIEEHAHNIRRVADRIWPEACTQIDITVTKPDNRKRDIAIQTYTGFPVVIDTWIASEKYGDVIGVGPNNFTVITGAKIIEYSAKRHLLCTTNANGLLTLRLQKNLGITTFHLAVVTGSVVNWSTVLIAD